MSADVEIVIPVFNGMPYLRRALSSALAQSAPAVRVTVVDNASTDGTWEWLSTIAQKEHRMRLIRNPKNIGMISNIRKCFNAIEAQSYCFLCADDMLFSPESIATASGILNSGSSVGVVYSDMAYIDTSDRILLHRRARREGPFPARPVGWNSILQGRNLFGIPVLARTDLIPSTAFDGSLVYAADLDLALSMGSLSTCWHHPAVLIANRYHERNATGTLHRGSEAEFHSIALRNGYVLTTTHRVAMKALHVRTRILKDLFLLFARWRGSRFLDNAASAESARSSNWPPPL